MNGFTAFSTWFLLRVGSNAAGDGLAPFSSRMAAAWRASTWTIEPAAPRTSFD